MKPSESVPSIKKDPKQKMFRAAQYHIAMTGLLLKGTAIPISHKIYPIMCQINYQP